MFENLIGKIAVGWIDRAILGFGLWVVHDGLLTKDQAAQMTGALMTLAPLAFSAWVEWQAQQKKDAAILAASQPKGN